MGKLAAIALLFSVQAYACPELTGTYTCTYNDGSKEVISISQTTDRNGLTIYNYDGSEIPADNKHYVVPDDQTLKEGTFRAWCEDNVSLKTQLLGKYYQDGGYYGDLTLNVDFSLNGRELRQVTSGSVKNTGGQFPLSGNTTCVRN